MGTVVGFAGGPGLGSQLGQLNQHMGFSHGALHFGQSKSEPCMSDLKGVTPRHGFLSVRACTFWYLCRYLCLFFPNGGCRCTALHAAARVSVILTHGYIHRRLTCAASRPWVDASFSLFTSPLLGRCAEGDHPPTSRAGHRQPTPKLPRRSSSSFQLRAGLITPSGHPTPHSTGTEQPVATRRWM